MSVTARGCVFFYGHKKGEHWCFSQFAQAEFYDEDGERYTCAEQFMMASKARVMGDEKTLANIMACDYNPTAIKALGRQVKPWDEEKSEVWRVPRLSPPRWRAAWTRAVDDLVAYESATPVVPDEAERLVRTWHRVLISLARHFDTLYSERAPG